MRESEHLDKKGIEDIISLTPMQEGMLFHYLKAPRSDLYFEQLCLNISGEIDVDVFKRAWNFVVETNEMLRTTFRWQTVKEPVQIILKKHNLDIRYSETKKPLKEILSRDRREKFDLREVPFRVTLCRVERGKYAMILSHHHILYDGWSNGIILREFFIAYDDLSSNKIPFPPTKGKFRDFVGRPRSQDTRQQKEYWQKYLGGFDTKTELPFHTKKRRHKEHQGIESHQIKFGFDLRGRLESFVKKRQVTMADLLYCAWGILLLKYNDGEDIVFGATVSGRSAKIGGIENIVGLFINTLPLRVKASFDEKIVDLLIRLSRSGRVRENYESTPLAVIKECSEIDNKEELFDSVVVMENYPLDSKLARQSSQLALDSYSIYEMTDFVLTVGISMGDDIEIVFDYEAGLWAKETVTGMSRHFKFIVGEIAEHPEKKIAEIDILSEAEKNRILFEFNDTGVEYAADKRVHELFDAQAAGTPDAVAAVFKRDHLTYKALAGAAGRLAGVLRAKGPGANIIVGLLVDRSIEMVVGMMGILKAGGAYLPLDPDYPAERIAYMMKDSGLELLVKGGIFAVSLPAGVTSIDLTDIPIFNADHSHLNIESSLTDLACVIYTSGSTGKAKGVMLEHRNILDYIYSVTRMFKISGTDIVLQQFSIAFDAAIEEIYPPLSNGGRLVMLSREETRDIDVLVERIEEERVTVISVSPLLLNEINSMAAGKLRSIRLVLVGGDVLKPEFFDNIIKSKQVYNGYGPTETTVCVTFHKCGEHEVGNIPIGKPMANTRIFIVGKRGTLLPIGVAGELCIGGDGVSRGYLRRDELTKEKFVENPFVPGERFYKSGDLARWLPDGSLEFFGRMDDQVKIRGYRIEPAEIETLLSMVDGIKDAVVMARQDSQGDRYLCAYVVRDSSGAVNTSELREYLSRQLPHYMVPTYFVSMPKIPVTANGKVDKKALPEPEYVRPGQAHSVPTDEVEEKMLAIWAAVLGKEKEGIGLDDHFFDLGGHSLKTISLSSLIHREFNVKIKLAEMFKILTIRGLSEYLKGAVKTRYFSPEPVEKREYYALSSAQKRLFILQQLQKDHTAYNITGALEVRGDIEIRRLEQIFAALVKRHEGLRTSFALIDDEPVQRIHDVLKFEIEDYDIGGEGSQDEAGTSIIKDFVSPFNLCQAPLFRLGWLMLGGEKHILMMDMHHIVGDGISIEILVKEFTELYRGGELPCLKLQYRDYTHWQNRRRGREEVLRQRDYWLGEFSGEIPALSLPTDDMRPVVQSFEGAALGFEIGGAETRALRTMASQEGVTLFTVLLTVFNIFLSKVSGQEDVVVGSPTAGRQHTDVESIIGMFVNTLALRNFPAGEFTFMEFLKDVNRRALEAFDNQEYQFEDLVEALTVNASRDTSRNPLFDVMFGLENVEGREIEIPGLQVKPLGLEVMRGTAKFDISLSALEGGERVSFLLEYSTKLFKEKTIGRLLGCFKEILTAVVKNPRIRLAEIDMVGSEQKRQLLYDFNDTVEKYPQDMTIHVLFEQQVERTPDRASVVFAEKQLTYKEWSERANQWAGLLRSKGVEANSIVGLIAKRSLEMVEGLMAIMKAGGAYLPIDPDSPPERVGYMLKDSGAALHLAAGHTAANLGKGREIIDPAHTDLNRYSRKNLKKRSGPRDLIYLIYTSGSTGNPKGVMIEHRSVVNRLNWMQRLYPIGEQDVILQKTPFVFDVSVWELFWGSMCGALLCLLEPGGEKSPQVLIEAVEKNRVTTMHFVPSMLKAFLEYIAAGIDLPRLAALNRVFSSAEALRPREVVQFNRQLAEKNGTKLINLYGPTEATVDVSYFNCFPGESFDIIPIGRPIDNNRLYILNQYVQLQPVGIAGELCIAGAGLARGYLNRSELTVEKFVSPPLVRGERLYKTGDLACFLPDGNIEFLGRIDCQVKIRGFRVELTEIESRLLTHSHIKEAVVLLKEDKEGEPYLCAYVVPGGGSMVSPPQLRTYLAESVPEYMVPAYFVQMSALPLNPNGKVDRQSLPEPKLRIEVGYAAPGNELEEKIAEIWGESLGIEKKVIGIDTNFFELGGHSLRAIQMISKLHKALGVRLTLAEVFKAPTIRRLVKTIEKTAIDVCDPIEPTALKEYYKMSSAQRRLFALQQMDLQSINYNVPQIIVLEKELKKPKLEAVFRKLIERHENLRTSFDMIAAEPVQKIHEGVDFDIEYYDLKEGIRSQEAIDRIIKDFVRPFDLGRAPLLRVGLVKSGEDRHILMVDIHHIVTDGLSQKILLKDFVEAYRGVELPVLRIQYKDYAAWQNSQKRWRRLQNQEKFWLREFEDGIPLLNLPTDFLVPVVQSFEGDTLCFEIGRAGTTGLNRLALARGATLYMVLLAVFNILLARLSGEEDIVVGTPTAGRRHEELESIMGVFVNTLALRNYPKADRTFVGFLDELKHKTLAAFENQDYPFEDLVERVVLERDVGRNPLFDVMFTLQNFLAEPQEILKEEIFGKVSQYRYENRVSKFNLTLSGMERGESLFFEVEYCRKLFKAETILRFIDYFKGVVSAVLASVDQKIAEIEIMSETEKTKILYGFNNTASEYPQTRAVHEAIEEQVERSPDNIVLVGQCLRPVGNLDIQQISYKELNNQSNRLARLLRKKGTKPNNIIGIMAEPSLDMVVGTVAILKAGGAFLPFVSEFPVDRIRYMLTDGGVGFLLTHTPFTGMSLEGCAFLDLGNTDLFTGGEENPENVNDSDDLAYVIYTSGSTGQPKGVMIEHRSLNNLCQWHCRYYAVTSVDRAAKYAGFSFDASVWEIFPYLTAGASIYPIAGEMRPDIAHLNSYFEEKNITIGFLPTQVCEQFMKLGNRSLRLLLTGGDKLKYFIKNDYQMVNNYGPTENTVVSTSFIVEDHYSNIPIGRPISNTQIYILSQHFMVQPIGIPGEICITGDGLSRGYLNSPELTLEKFVSPPFLEGKLLYRTGDLGRWLADGSIEFLGRIDFQVKIRGYRIELAEIESQLLDVASIKEALVAVLKDNEGEKYLCAYIVSDDEPDTAELKSILSRSIPHYMIPACFVRIESVPLTFAGKVNRKALPPPVVKTGGDDTAPTGVMEKKLAGIWSEVLGIEKETITREADFWGLGGHSLKATVLLSLIHREFNVNIPLVDIFKRPTLRGLAQYIKDLTQDMFIPVDPVEKREFYPPSSAQKRLFVLCRIEAKSTAYNLPALMMIEGGLQRGRFGEAIHRLIERHESLRTSFSLIEGRVVQVIHEAVDFRIEYREIAGQEQAVTTILREHMRPFDLSRAPLFRVVLARLAAEKDLLFFDMHHIVSDGVSMALLVREFIELYEAGDMPALRIQYRDFSQWQNKLFATEKIKKMERYWLDKFKEKIPPLNIPSDYPRPKVQDFLGDSIKCELKKALAEKLYKFTGGIQTTLFMVFLAVFNVLLARYTRQEDIVVGTPIAGRNHADLKNVIGLFVNTLAMRNRPEGEKTFREFLEEVTGNALEAYENQDYPFDALIDKLSIPRDLGRNPLTDVWLVSESIDMPEFDIRDLKFRPLEFESGITHSDLVLYIYDTGRGIYMVLEYATSLFKRSTVEEMLERFVDIIGHLLENPDIKLKHIEIAHNLSSAESRFQGELQGDFDF
jgi:tyrocidine synthetase-3